MEDVREPNVYTVPSNPEYWGPECRPERAEELAEALADALRQYAEAEGLDVEIRVVPERSSFGNRASGNPDVIHALEVEEERLCNDGVWDWARDTRAWEEWR